MKNNKKLICIFLVTIFLIFLIPINNVSAKVNIPKGAVEYNGNYYYIYKQQATWEYAKTNCESVGGHLVTITSIDEQTFIEGFIGQSEISFWMGATYTNYSSGEFKWVTGEKSDYTKWQENDPKNSIYYDVLVFNNVGWSVYEDYERLQYICEWEMNDYSESLPTKVIINSAKKSSNTSVNISWKEIKDAEGYSIYRKTGSEGEYEKIVSIDEADITTYSVENLSNGTTYYFRIRAFKTIYGEKSYGELSAAKKIALK
jgi:hypothetical protein